MKRLHNLRIKPGEQVQQVRNLLTLKHSRRKTAGDILWTSRAQRVFEQFLAENPQLADRLLTELFTTTDGGTATGHTAFFRLGVHRGAFDDDDLLHITEPHLLSTEGQASSISLIIGYCIGRSSYCERAAALSLYQRASSAKPPL